MTDTQDLELVHETGYGSRLYRNKNGAWLRQSALGSITPVSQHRAYTWLLRHNQREALNRFFPAGASMRSMLTIAFGLLVFFVVALVSLFFVLRAAQVAHTCGDGEMWYREHYVPTDKKVYRELCKCETNTQRCEYDTAEVP